MVNYASYNNSTHSVPSLLSCSSSEKLSLSQSIFDSSCTGKPTEDYPGRAHSASDELYAPQIPHDWDSMVDVRSPFSLLLLRAKPAAPMISLNTRDSVEEKRTNVRSDSSIWFKGLGIRQPACQVSYGQTQLSLKLAGYHPIRPSHPSRGWSLPLYGNSLISNYYTEYAGLVDIGGLGSTDSIKKPPDYRFPSADSTEFYRVIIIYGVYLPACLPVYLSTDMPTTPPPPAPRPKSSRDQRLQVLTLRDAGFSYKAISDQLGLSYCQVQILARINRLPQESLRVNHPSSLTRIWIRLLLGYLHLRMTAASLIAR